MRFTCALAAALLSAASLSAQAATNPELRVMGIDVRSPAPPNGVGPYYEGRDFFSNGNPLHGMVYTYPATGATITGGYRPSPFAPGTELSGPAADFIGVNFGAGGLSFRAQDAVASNTNLTPPGYDAKAIDLRLQFLDPRPPASIPGASFEGLLNVRGSFDVFTAWDFLLPDPGATYGVRINGAPAADGSFQDRLDVRIVTSLAGATTVDFDRVARSAAGVLSRTSLGSVSLSSAYAGDLADVDYIVFGLQRDLPPTGGNTPVSAGFELLDASLSNGDLTVLATFDFTSNRPTIFNDADTAQLIARASWLTPTVAAVPEPSTYALMALGFLVIGAIARRRKA